MSLKRKKMAVEASNASTQTSFWTSRQATLISGGLIFVAVLAAYCNTFAVPFTLDDQPAIVENATLRHLWPIQRALSPPPGAITVSGRPVLNLSLALNYALSATKVWSYHAVNLAIHILASLTLFGIMRRTLLAPLWKNRFENSALPLALAVALLWALHPLQTEAVTYVIQRAESLMGLFYLLTLYCFIRAALGISNLKFQISNTAGPRPISNLKFQISNTAGPRPISNFKSPISNPWFVLCIAACLLGMGTKEVMVSAPLMVLLYDRAFVACSFGRALRQRWGFYAGLAATWLLLAAESGAQKSNLNATISPWHYALTQSWAIVHYLRLTVWPHPLVFDYGEDLIQRLGEAAPWALIVAALVAGTIVSLRRWPKIGFLGFWFFAILAPTSSVMPLGGQTVAEHRMYLPLAAVMALMVIGAYRLGTEGIAGWGTTRSAPREPGIAFSVIWVAVVLALSLVTRERNEDYRTEEGLWSDTAARRPNNARAHHNLGTVLVKAGRLDDGMEQFRIAVDLFPGYVEALNNLGIGLCQKGQVDEAMAVFQRALSFKTNDPDVRINLGNAFRQQGRLAEAVREFQAVLAVRPQDANALNNLGTALLLQGRADDAIVQYQAALAIEPDRTAAHDDLADALIQKGRLDEAASHYQKALQLRSDDAAAHKGLGVIFLRQGRVQEAISHWERAAELQPNFANVQNNLADALVMGGRFEEAVAHFNKALELQPQDLPARNNLAWLLATCPDATIRDGAAALRLAQRADQLSGGQSATALHTLAAAYAETRQFPEAVTTAQRALGMATAQNNSALANATRAQLRLYQTGLPFRDTASTNAASGRRN